MGETVSLEKYRAAKEICARRTRSERLALVVLEHITYTDFYWSSDFLTPPTVVLVDDRSYLTTV